MLTGKLVYRSGVSGEKRIQAPSFDLKSFESCVDRITIDLSNTDRIHLTVKFNEVESEEMATGVADRVSRQLIDRISFLEKIQLKDPKLVESNLQPLNPEQHTCYASAIGACFGIGTGLTNPRVYHLDEETIVGLKNSLEQVHLRGESALPLFRLVIRSEDTTEQYLLLYAMLLSYVGPKQDAINDFIRDKEANLEERHSPWTNQDEPIYTWLRNELAHYQRTPGTSLADIRQQMVSRLGGLQALVHKAIEALPA